MNRWDEFKYLLSLKAPGLSMVRDSDLTQQTSMRMKTRAAVHATVDDIYSLKMLAQRVRETGVPAYLLGAGANTLFATSYFEGLVFQLGGQFKEKHYMGGNILSVGAGVQLPGLITEAKKSGLMGLEFLTMIPGTVGGALAGNAGAGGWGLCDYVERVFLMTRDGFIAQVNRNEFRYGYRYSELRESIILGCDLRLEPFNKFESERRKKDFADKKKGQPYNLPSCGCIFKNPKDSAGNPIPAGKLIDESGLKGYAIRAAQVSLQHANFMVNQGGSSGEDFLALINLVRDMILQKHGVELETEVQIVGGPMSSVVLA